MNVADIRTRVKRNFGDESGVQITDDDITRWINDGQRQIVLQNEGLLEKTATANCTVNIQEYSLPSDILILRAVHFKYTGEESYFWLRGYSLNEFNEYIDGWDGSTFNKGRPLCYTVYAGQLKVFPIPDTTITSAFKIYYTRSPVDVSGPTDTPDLPILYHESLVKYCLTQAYEIDEDWTASEQKAAELATDLKLLRGREDWKKQETYPLITVLDEDI
jgi:hypothetical protein